MAWSREKMGFVRALEALRWRRWGKV